MWCTKYQQMNQGKIPIEQTLVFDEDNIYDFDPNTFKIGSKSSKFNIKYNETITSNIDNENMDFRVKLYKLPDFDGKQHSWINPIESFEAISEAVGI